MFTTDSNVFSVCFLFVQELSDECLTAKLNFVSEVVTVYGKLRQVPKLVDKILAALLECHKNTKQSITWNRDIENV